MGTGREASAAGEKFLVERYQKRPASGDLTHVAKVLRRCARDLTREGEAVRYVRSVFLPGDETCLDFFVASSAHAVSEATRRAGLSYDRIVAYE
jgi:hypothetical protein